jgi:hypothetical protein
LQVHLYKKDQDWLRSSCASLGPSFSDIEFDKDARQLTCNFDEPDDPFRQWLLSNKYLPTRGFKISLDLIELNGLKSPSKI